VGDRPEVRVTELPGHGRRVEASTIEAGTIEAGTIEAETTRSGTAAPAAGEARPSAAIDLTERGARDTVPPAVPAVSPSIDIRWIDDGACVVELRGRATRAMLTQARDLLWSHKPTDRLTVVVSEAVLTRDLFAMLIAGRRRLSAGGLFEIVGLDAQGARRIADRPLVARRRRT
jgi:hypothetical protein